MAAQSTQGDTMARLDFRRHAPSGSASRITVSGQVAVAIAGAMLAGVACAQTAPASDDTKTDTGALQEVVVTAQFHRENLQQTPVAITAITGEMLTERNETSLQDVASQAPNVILQQNPAGAGNSMRAQIRGVGQTDLDPAVDPGVGIYIDDVYFATLTGSDFALVDLDRVEILRGPQGTLSGMNSLGGSVKMYTKKPTGGDDGYVSASYGSFNKVELRGSGDFTVIPDHLFVRVSGVSTHDNGYVQLIDYACSHPTDPFVVAGIYPHGNFTSDCKSGTEGGVDYTALRAAVRWVPADAVEANWVIDATQDNSGSTATTLLGTGGYFASQVPNWMNGAPYDNRFLPPGPYASYANFLDPGLTYVPTGVAGTAGAKLGAFYANPNNTLNSWGTSLTIDWKLTADLALKSISAYRHYTSQFGDDNSASPVPLVLEEARFSHQQSSEELRLSGAWGKLVDYTLGGIYFDYTTYYASREDDPFLAPFYGGNGGTTPTFDFLQNDPTHTTTKAGFFNSGWHFTDALTLNTGVRYTSEDKTYTYHRLNIDGVTPYPILSNPANPLNGKVGEFSGSHTDYRVDLDYQWTPTLMTYAEYSTGFKGGGVTPRPYYPQQVIGFGPETLKSAEIGLKSEWFDRSLRANLAAFYEWYDNYQAFATPATCVDSSGNPLPPQYANPCGEYRNVADAVGKGFEAEFDYLLGGLSINASFGYLDEYFTKSQTTAVSPGQVPPNIGKIRASGGIQYDFMLGGHGSVTPRVDVAYTPQACGDLGCTSAVDNPAYTVANARLTYESSDKHWSAALEVSNFTDKLYYLSRVNTGAGYIDGQIAPPREWAITLRRNF
jgi:iron complex outermembrane recepter protein